MAAQQLDKRRTPPEATPDLPGRPDGRTADAAVVVRDLVTRFGAVVACDRVDLTVGKGELVAIVGRSGSGKSTLLRNLNGLVAPTSGDVRVLDANVPELRGGELRRLRRRVGMVFQQFQLVGRLTAMENVLSGALGRVRGPRYGVLAWPKDHRRDALAQLDRVGLGDRAFQRVDTLSGGQQQRVAIARMLMQRLSSCSPTSRWRRSTPRRRHRCWTSCSASVRRTS